jgi:hydrogenase-4 membrane subunit HyfE
MLSKALTLVLCAATTYFALAISALKINLIRGIEPRPFIFTLSFSTLIMLLFLIVNELNHVVFCRSGCR